MVTGCLCMCVQTLLPRIVGLWEAVQVPLVHRSRFFLAFRGRETFYYEAEHRRLIHQHSQVCVCLCASVCLSAQTNIARCFVCVSVSVCVCVSVCAHECMPVFMFLSVCSCLCMG